MLLRYFLLIGSIAFRIVIFAARAYAHDDKIRLIVVWS
jgi:hypothetical protein